AEGDRKPLPQGGFTTKPRVATNGSAPWDEGAARQTNPERVPQFHRRCCSTLSGSDRAKGPPTQGALPPVTTLGCDVMPFQGRSVNRMPFCHASRTTETAQRPSREGEAPAEPQQSERPQ